MKKLEFKNIDFRYVSNPIEAAQDAQRIFDVWYEENVIKMTNEFRAELIKENNQLRDALKDAWETVNWVSSLIGKFTTNSGFTGDIFRSAFNKNAEWLSKYRSIIKYGADSEEKK